MNTKKTEKIQEESKSCASKKVTQAAAECKPNTSTKKPEKK